MSERTGDMTSLKYLRSWVGQEYKPCDLQFGIDKIWNWISDGVTGLKKNESSGELDFLRYSVNGHSAGGIFSSDNAVKHIFAEKNTYRGIVNMLGICFCCVRPPP